MIQSDALSRRPDFCPDEDTDNENIIMLPDDMFLNLIDTDLQDRITMAENMDSDATEALTLLLESGPTAITAGLNDWKVEQVNGRPILFYKGKNYIPKKYRPPTGHREKLP